MTTQDQYTTQDYKVDQGWLRVFCAPLPDDTCGLLLFQHHFQDNSPYFDHLEEANIGIVTGGSYEGAMMRLNMGGDQAPIPAAYRRLNRLLVNGSLVEGIKDTLAERGLVRAVAYSASDKPEDTRLAMFDRASFYKETRTDKEVRILDL